MARPNIQQARLFAQLIDQLTPEVRRGFMASVTDLSANVNWRALLAALEAGNIDSAIAALNIAPEAWAEYSAVVSDAYAKSGAATMAQITANGIVQVGTRFRMTNPRAEEWMRRNVAESVVGFTQEQIKSAREVISNGYALGNHPHTIARDLVGRVGASGVREGGIMGLDAPRAMRLDRVRQGMRTAEGVKDLVIEHADGSLSLRYKVNKATGDRIFKAYRSETAVPAAERAISERQYYNALMKARADTVAETETGNAVMSARQESWEQAAESQGLDKSAVRKTWQHRRGASRYHRPDHLAMSGKSVEGLDTPFEFPDGARLQHAHDVNGGARHTIRCGCSTEYRLDHARGLV